MRLLVSTLFVEAAPPWLQIGGHVSVAVVVAGPRSSSTLNLAACLRTPQLQENARAIRRMLRSVDLESR